MDCIYLCLLWGTERCFKIALGPFWKNWSNAKDLVGLTAFNRACQFGRKTVVKLLLKNSAAKDIDILTGREKLHNDMKAFIDKQQRKRRKVVNRK